MGVTRQGIIGIAEWAGIAFGAWLVLYVVVGGFRAAFTDHHGWKRALTIGYTLLLTPAAFGFGWVIGLWLWPLAVAGIAVMAIMPFRLLTKDGRDDLAYTMRWDAGRTDRSRVRCRYFSVWPRKQLRSVQNARILGWERLVIREFLSLDVGTQSLGHSIRVSSHHFDHLPGRRRLLPDHDDVVDELSMREDPFGYMLVRNERQVTHGRRREAVEG